MNNLFEIIKITLKLVDLGMSLIKFCIYMKEKAPFSFMKIRLILKKYDKGFMLLSGIVLRGVAVVLLLLAGSFMIFLLVPNYMPIGKIVIVMLGLITQAWIWNSIAPPIPKVVVNLKINWKN